METSSFVKQLASNNRKVRENALATLKKYLNTRQFKENKQLQFDKLWKGLYFAMWFSDRPRPQQRLANELGELHLLYFDAVENKQEITLDDKAFIKFSKGFWKVICLEWYSIDHHRLDKYLLLVRRVLFNQLKYLKLRNWNEELVLKYIDSVLKKLPLSGDKKVYNGIPFHIIDIFVDEWEKLVIRDGEDEGEDGEEKDSEECKQLIAATPLSLFVEIFQDLSSNIENIKVLREKIKEDILGDQRLHLWGILTQGDDKVENGEEEEEEEEWKGF